MVIYLYGIYQLRRPTMFRSAKKIISLVLSAITVISVISPSVFATGDNESISVTTFDELKAALEQEGNIRVVLKADIYKKIKPIYRRKK